MSNHGPGTQTCIDAIVTPFDRAWRGGQRPRIEELLVGVAEPRRSHLLAELLRVEQEYRRETGEEPMAAEYEPAIPGARGGTIRELFAGVRSPFQRETVECPEQFSGEIELIRQILRETAEATPDAEATPWIRGEVYIAQKRSGVGAQGTVYRALEDQPHRSSRGGHQTPPGRVARLSCPRQALSLIDEIRMLAYINHSHVVRYLDSGEDRGQLYCVMRLMRGGSLAQFLKERREPLDPDEAARLMTQIAEAVRYLHTQPRPILHRDLKPQNIFRDEAGKLYVGDFGLAALLRSDGSLLEAGACGTPGYIAPEQLDGRFGKVGPASDIYSLGVILYEMITRQVPFPRTGDWASLIRTLDRNPIRPGRVRPGIPEPLERICLKCMQKLTTARYRSAEELVEDLEAFRERRPLPNTPPDTAWQRIRDWARNAPALAARLAVIVACSAILWSYRLIVGNYAPLLEGHWAGRPAVAAFLGALGPIESVLVWMNQALLAAWGLASWAFQRRLTRNRHGGGLQLGWRVVDVAALCLLIQLDDALMSPLTVAFAVLIVASAFRARADQILQTTLLSMW